jgi:hypothetical protein
MVVEEKAQIPLSQTIKLLLSSLKRIHARRTPDEFTRLTVSQTVSLFAILYEKVRTSLEVKDDHLIVRAAIDRILKRRFSLNPSGKDEAEHLLRELMWARYIPNGSVDDDDIQSVQHTIETYVTFSRSAITTYHGQQDSIRKFLFEMMTCEVEEIVTPRKAQREMLFSYLLFQSLHGIVQRVNTDEKYKDALLFLAIEKAFRKSDAPYQRYHLFTLLHKPLTELNEQEQQETIQTFPTTITFIDSITSHRRLDVLEKYVRKQLPPFLVLFSILRGYDRSAEAVLRDKKRLWQEVEKECMLRYKQAHIRVMGFAVRASIYITLIKLITALAIEFPLYYYWYTVADFIPVLISTIFFPIVLMGIALTFSIPRGANTKRIYLRILDILTGEISSSAAKDNKRSQYTVARQYQFIFQLIYGILFVFTLGSIIAVLTLIGFHPVSQIIFIIFLSIMLYIAYKIRMVAHEYRYRERDSLISPVMYVFVVPYITAGKSLSHFLSSINLSFITNSIDFIIETPFKLVIEVIDEWSSFIRSKKEDIM